MEAVGLVSSVAGIVQILGQVYSIGRHVNEIRKNDETLDNTRLAQMLATASIVLEESSKLTANPTTTACAAKALQAAKDLESCLKRINTRTMQELSSETFSTKLGGLFT